jgi:hypothetical protein
MPVGTVRFSAGVCALLVLLSAQVVFQRSFSELNDLKLGVATNGT